MKTYLGCTFHPTRTTTETVATVYGKSRPIYREVWEVEGRYSKSAGRQPFLTSAAACRAWCRQQRDSQIRADFLATLTPAQFCVEVHGPGCDCAKR